MAGTDVTPQPTAGQEESGGSARRGWSLPEIPGPLETARLAWRKLRKMSTALILLFSIAAASIVATFVPQEPTVPTTVADWRGGTAGPGELWAGIFDRLGFFDVFGAWWFTVLTALLFVSLTGCLLPRWSAFLRVARRPPAAGRNFERLTHHTVLATGLEPEAALAAAEPVLRRRRFRRRRLPADETVSGAPQLAGERGHTREGGSLVFHTAFYVLLIGIVIGEVYGFTGQINLPEGSAFADTRIAYDAVEPGREFGLDDHRGFVVSLDDFEVSYFDDFTPAEFVSDVTISENGEPVRSGEVRVNHPLGHDGMKLYQARFGMAPRIRVSAGDNVLFDEAVMLSDAGASVWTGAAKVAVRDPETQIALDLVFLPDARVENNRPFSASPEPNNPRLVAQLYVGELGLQRPVPASQFDRSGGPLGAPAILAPGQSQDMAAGNLTVEFTELRHWSGFQVTHAPGRGILLAAAILILVGLLPSLYSYRRRVWVEARGGTGATDVVVAGVALQRKNRFAEEYDALVAALRTVLPPPDAAPAEDTEAALPGTTGEGYAR